MPSTGCGRRGAAGRRRYRSRRPRRPRRPCGGPPRAPAWAWARAWARGSAPPWPARSGSGPASWQASCRLRTGLRPRRTRPGRGRARRQRTSRRWPRGCDRGRRAARPADAAPFPQAHPGHLASDRAPVRRGARPVRHTHPGWAVRPFPAEPTPASAPRPVPAVIGPSGRPSAGVRTAPADGTHGPTCPADPGGRWPRPGVACPRIQGAGAIPEGGPRQMTVASLVAPVATASHRRAAPRRSSLCRSKRPAARAAGSAWTPARRAPSSSTRGA